MCIRDRSELIRQLDRLDPEVYLETLREKPYLEQLAKAGLIMVVKDILGGKRELEIDSSHDFAKALGIDKNQMRRCLLYTSRCVEETALIHWELMALQPFCIQRL